jgi:hypothetical protein
LTYNLGVINPMWLCHVQATILLYISIKIFGLISCNTHVTIFILLVSVIMGEELAALWKFFHYQKSLNVNMPSFDVIYVVGNAGSTIVKLGTMDCGGRTKHVLSTTWFDYFDNNPINSNHKFKTFYHDIICKD